MKKLKYTFLLIASLLLMATPAWGLFASWAFFVAVMAVVELIAYVAKPNHTESFFAKFKKDYIDSKLWVAAFLPGPGFLFVAVQEFEAEYLQITEMVHSVLFPFI